MNIDDVGMDNKRIRELAKAQLGNDIFGTYWLYAALAVFVCTAIMVGAGAFFYGAVATLFVTGPALYGLNKYVLSQSRDVASGSNLSILMDSIRDRTIGKTFMIFLIQTVITVVFCILLIVPGIVRAYGYSMAYYICVDHPEYDWRACLSESRKLMQGHKWDLFKLNMSMLGWFFLGILCFGVGSLWATAYANAAKAQFYANLTGYVGFHTSDDN